MSTDIKEKKCGADGCENSFTPYRTTDKFCSYRCASRSKKNPFKGPKKRIRPVSKKRARINCRYTEIRNEFMRRPENQKCPVTGDSVTDNHHKMGKIGYADEWARENDVPLLIDTRYFLAVSRDGHRWIEENPVKAKERGFSLNRLSLNGTS